MNNILSKPKSKFKVRNNKKYEVKSIINSMVYDKEVKSHILGFYYLVL